MTTRPTLIIEAEGDALKEESGTKRPKPKGITTQGSAKTTTTT